MDGSSLDRRTTASLGAAGVRPASTGDDERLLFASDTASIEARI